MTIRAILFDIDGTLIKCFGAGKRSLITACEEVFGTVGMMEGVDFQGKTDPLILLESLRGMGYGEEEINRNLETLKRRYFHHLEINIQDGASVMLPGVLPLLERLSLEKGILRGLLTGNFRESARIKLDRFDLYRFFPFGVFGDDASLRNDMPPIARRIIRDIFNIEMDYGDIVIIGDTIHDIECARAVGAVSVSVGTGWVGRETLISLEPDHYFDDLSDTDGILESILA
ncbi:MAG: HAD hydrolase-like protein [Spirochaetes bacterium]|nr:HAD hydrolase-like protein [Spirochaetota bacterium]